ncbi:MAG TPA: PEP/pyruvate-binding domain-containing protein, partial [Usitatibacteraceae bacterium]|nr:PEP/pyruvate-binding domain-containing protein [Usitatibacteraceae bacterium]
MATRTARKGRAARTRATPAEKWVYLFSEGNASRKDLLGGKGANLAEMTRMGLPVPPGFIVSTRACNAYLAAGGFPEAMWSQVERSLAKVERLAGKRLGDAQAPLLVSCRSGARFSMPGMMDTVLNIGMNDAVAAGLAKLAGDARFVNDAYRRLVQMFGTVVLGLPDEPFEAVLARERAAHGVANDADLGADTLLAITAEFKRIVKA